MPQIILVGGATAAIGAIMIAVQSTRNHHGRGDKKQWLGNWGIYLVLVGAGLMILGSESH